MGDARWLFAIFCAGVLMFSSLGLAWACKGQYPSSQRGESRPALQQGTSSIPLDQAGADEKGKASGEMRQKIDVGKLIQRLKDSRAIGFFTKLAIRGDILDLKHKVDRYRQEGTLEEHLQEVRREFDGLLLKIMALLEADPTLSRDVYLARDQIWSNLLETKT